MGFSCVSPLLLVCGMGAGLGRGEYLDFGLFPIRNQQFFSIHLDGAKKTNMIFNRFFFSPDFQSSSLFRYP